ncbi:hypothetical protein JCM3775_001100 [Rhodotorula graminis]|uniref:Acetoacetate decarboxylase n=1 Tax=Rhodotorula graminis (strain WP1) TaxID=578459 RepID=A0A194S4X7_RHOGW|nr:uncharacterized protein RHOBADRAFT_53543 [Rhodotorula graminis WP1]KPV75579.1 hypothetical protein RHOBADRAFT_53543 [Rhodotorula graminis WP1]
MAAPAPQAIPVCSAPWSLTGEGWILPLFTPFSKEPIPLPSGAYAPLERGSKADLSERYHGGFGVVLVVRYESSNVGPYDELMIIPGLFSHPGKDGGGGEPSYALAITRIYVSTVASVANGRREWGIPKHRAVFDFQISSSGRTTLSVSHPSSPSTPFFRIAFRPSRLTPLSIPIRTSWLSTRLARVCMAGYEPALVQPPLPAAEEGDDQGTGQRADALVASEQPYRVEPSAAGWARAVVVEAFPEEEEGEGKDGSSGRDWSGFGDGEGFPHFEVYGARLNLHVQGLEMGFPVPSVVEG